MAEGEGILAGTCLRKPSGACKNCSARELGVKRQKITVMNDFLLKKAKKQGKTANFGAKIVHNRKKVQIIRYVTVKTGGWYG